MGTCEADGCTDHLDVVVREYVSLCASGREVAHLPPESRERRDRARRMWKLLSLLSSASEDED